jgi:hypothetical protein
MGQAQLGQDSLRSIGEIDEDLAVVPRIMPPFDQTIHDEPVYQLNSTIVLDAEPIGQDANGDMPFGRAFDGQQRLMLLGTQPHFRCCAFAELQKTTELVTKLGQTLVIRLVE